ncbi:MAG: alpha/beta hydrolase [Cyclobacteriaceae bacterium]
MMDPIYYRQQGSGPTVILIHGFPMNHEVWNNFAKKLSASVQVVTVDLPGFGESPALPNGFSLEDVAKTVYAWIKDKNYYKPVIVGHSLGGYVALAIAEEDLDLMAGMCLFHSTAVADSQEKKDSRNKVLELIDKKGVEAFTSNFIGQLYADPKHSSIAHVKKIAVRSSKDAVAGYTKAMRDRKDRTGVLNRFPRPIFFLSGEKDQGISPESVKQQALNNRLAEVTILQNVAHMGMFEEENVCLEKIEKFVGQCQVTS